MRLRISTIKMVIEQLKKLPYNDVSGLINELTDAIPTSTQNIAVLSGIAVEPEEDYEYEIDTEIICNKPNPIGFKI